MTTDEIKLALRLVAMGRVNHPQVDELADMLAGVFSRKCEPLPVVEMPTALEIVAANGFADGSISPTETPLMAATPAAPKRRKKAD